MSTKQSYRSAFIFLTTLFFLWGFITVLVDSLIPRLKDVFEMSYAKTVVVQKIDRKVINVGKDLTAAGTTASELLRPKN